MKLVALHRFPYNGKLLDPEVEFDAVTADDAALLVKIGHAKLVRATKNVVAGAEKQRATRQAAPQLITKGA